MMRKLCHKIVTSFSAYETIDANKTTLSKFEARNFADQVRIKIAAGDGGNGCISFHADKRVRKGQPDGGDGGKGGHVVIEAHKNVFDLSHFRRRTVEGVNGGTGGSNGRDGKNGGQTIIRVPSGTLVYEIQVNQDEQTLQKTEKKKFLVDLQEHLSKYVIAKGGENGKGNKKNPFMREQHKFGKQGQRKIVYLELKSLADIGLVGFPNIGKSTFLASVSRALPKIANYEFTTLKPSIGHVHFVDDFSMTIADIPGIIEGAHLNKGLGLQFLRHVERTKVLIFVLDITAADPISQLSKLQFELNQYASDKFTNKYIVYDLGKNQQYLTKWTVLPIVRTCLESILPKYHIRVSSSRPKKDKMLDRFQFNLGELQNRLGKFRMKKKEKNA